MLTDSNKKHQVLGFYGEELVAQWLIERGFTLITRNYRRTSGEIDLIAKNSNLLVFVEVKTRMHNYFATSGVITISKQRKIILTARLYLAENSYKDTIYRFDVALVHKTGESYDVEYIPNAFNPES